jgi:hypothetical protein
LILNLKRGCDELEKEPSFCVGDGRDECEDERRFGEAAFSRKNYGFIWPRKNRA